MWVFGYSIPAVKHGTQSGSLFKASWRLLNEVLTAVIWTGKILHSIYQMAALLEDLKVQVRDKLLGRKSTW